MSEKNETNEYLRLLAKSSLIVFIAVILSKLLSYAYRVVIARGFGPEIFGLFSLGLIVLSTAGAIASVGLADGLLRYVSYYRGNKENNKINFVISKTTRITAILSILATLILLVFAEHIAVGIFHDAQLTYYIRVLSLGVPFSVIAGVFLSIIRAFERVTAYSFLVNVTHNFFKVAFLGLLFLAGLRRDAILFSYVLAYVALTIIAYWFIKYHIKELNLKKEKFSKKEKKIMFNSLFSYSWPLVFSSILLNLFFWIDSLVLGYYANAESVGLYGAAITLVGLFSIGQDLFMQLFVPVISKNLSLGKIGLIKELSKQIFKWIFIINLPLFIILLIFPGVVINIFFGSEYIEAQAALRILAIGALFSGFMSLFIGLINIKGNTKKVLLLFIIFSSLNFILDVILVQKYGMEGIAIATMIVWALFTLVLFGQVKKDYGFYPIRRKAVRIFLVSLVPSALLYYLSETLIPTYFNLIVTGLIFGLVYLGLILATKCLDRNDWEIINSVKDKFLKPKNKN